MSKHDIGTRRTQALSSRKAQPQGKKAGVSGHVLMTDHAYGVYRNSEDRAPDYLLTLDKLLGVNDLRDMKRDDMLTLFMSRRIREGFPLAVIENLKAAGVDTPYRNMIVAARTLQHRASKGEHSPPPRASVLTGWPTSWPRPTRCSETTIRA